MNKPAAFRATYSDLKLIKTRQCVQIVFELPLVDFDMAYDVLGGMPNSANERWFGIAAISADSTSRQESKPAGKRDWRDLKPSQQAGIRCEEPVFKAFLDECHTLAEWNGFTSAEAVRTICGVKSRSELNTNHIARVIWHQLDEQFQAWKAVEHA